MNEKRCPSCQQSNAAEMSFCINCGASLLTPINDSFSNQASYPNSNFGAGMPGAPVLPNLPPRPAQKSRAGLYIILGVLGVVLVVFVGGVVGFIALVNSIESPNPPANVNRSIVSVSPSPVSNRAGNYNSNSSIYNGNSRGVGNANSTIYNGAGSGNASSGGSTVYSSLTEGLTMTTIAQPQVGEFRLDSKEAAPNWKTIALEAENHYYSSPQAKPTLTVARFTTGEDARQALRDSIKMYKDRGEETSEISECVNRTDKRPIGITGTIREKNTNTFRRYWTDGKYLFAVGSIGDKNVAERFMTNSRY